MANKDVSQSDIADQKLDPKLRMCSNGSTEVNVIRSERCASIAVDEPKLLDSPEQRLLGAATTTFQPKSMMPRTLGRVPSNVDASVFIDMIDPNLVPQFEGETARRANLAIARVPLARLRDISGHDQVAYVEMAEPLVRPKPLALNDAVAPPSTALRKIGHSRLHHDGANVLIGLIDVEGFDFAHPDFGDESGKTRFVRIWDQGGDTRPSPGASPFNYGAELTDKHLNAAIANAARARVSPQDLEKQSQMLPESHGTHVASIAAGNRGVCRKAAIAGVLLSLPDADWDSRTSFYDSTRIAHAVDYLLALGETMNLPVSINVSLGTNGHAHDGSSAISRWIDAALATPGRSVCVAAGNAGQEAPEDDDDLGWIMGRIHTSGRIAAAGLESEIEWNVMGDGFADVSENELEIWYGAQDRFSVSLKPPHGQWTRFVEPGQYIENRQLPDGTLISIYNELYHPANGCNYISIYLSPNFSRTGIPGVRAGEWRVRLRGLDVRDGSYHGWIERDDPGETDPIRGIEAWEYPSFFSERSNVDKSSVSSLACGRWIISVANLDAGAQRINVSSSQGPTRDGRSKPEIAAPGTNIVAAKGFSDYSSPWISMTGTSMAAPYITGVVGLMLSARRKLTAAQIGGIIMRTARPLPGATFTWRDDAGYGAIDPEACVLEAASVSDRVDVT